MQKHTVTADFGVSGGRGSIFIVDPLNGAAFDHLNDVLDPENSQRWGKGVAVEQRFIDQFLDQLVADGFTLEGF